MTFIHRSVSRAALAAATAALGFGATSAVAQDHQWNMHIAFPPGNFHTQNAEAFAERVAEVTDGAVEITVHPGGALGLQGPEVMAAVRDGIVEAADYHLMQQVGEAPLMGINALPYLAVGYEDAWTLNEIARPYYEEIAAENNQIILYDVAWPGGQVYAGTAIETQDDFSGVRIRTADAIQSQFFEGLGASTVQMPWGDVVPGLASGVIDGVTTSTSSGVDGNFWEFVGHMTILDYVNPISVMAVNMDAWNALSEDHQEAIRAVAEEMREDFWARSESDDLEKLEILEQEGMTVTTVGADLHEGMVASGEAIWDDFIESVGEPAEQIIAEFRERVGR